MALPATTLKKGREKLALDFLMYITAPQNASRMCWNSMTIPNSPQARVHPKVKPFLKNVENHARFPRTWDGGSESIAMHELLRCMQLYLLDRITLDEAMNRLQDATTQSIAEIIEMRLFDNDQRWNPEKW